MATKYSSHTGWDDEVEGWYAHAQCPNCKEGFSADTDGHDTSLALAIARVDAHLKAGCPKK